MKFSVLLPTRNRLDLLSYAVETVRRQDYDDWEIIISDNFSDEDIGSYVAGLGDSRILYSRTSTFVSVTENWTNTLNRASGDYVIMLGDDDGLLQGYFRKMLDLINTYEQPDLIYTDGYLFAYAGALPDFTSSVLCNNCNSYFKSRRPFLIERSDANTIVQKALNLDIPIFYNMQLSTIRMDFIRSLADQGNFFQSPFPDYYSTIVMFLKAQRILIYQQSVVAIGISKKSFGFYYFSGREKDGESFLNNVSEQQSSRLSSVLIPGSVEINCRMLAMDAVALNYPREVQQAGAAINHSKYRAMMIRSGAGDYYMRKQTTREEFASVRKAVTLKEWLRYGIPYSLLYGFVGMLSIGQRKGLKSILQKLGRLSTTAWHPVQCKTMVDVFEQISPNLQSP
jgi:glycosyltransferase involved in cell wall biosynthesis